MLNKLCAPVGNMRIFIRIRILHVQSADPQSADPHFTRSLQRGKNDCYQWLSDSSRVHQIYFRPGLCLQRCPRHLSWI